MTVRNMMEMRKFTEKHTNTTETTKFCEKKTNRILIILRGSDINGKDARTNMENNKEREGGNMYNQVKIIYY